MRQEGEGRGSREAGRAQNTKGLAHLPWVLDFVQGSWKPLGAASRRVRWGRASICWAALQSTDLKTCFTFAKFGDVFTVTWGVG